MKTRTHLIAPILLGLALLTGGPVFADGGVVLLHQRAGSIVLTLFGPPVLRAGRTDLSVLVQNAANSEVVLGASVVLELSGIGALNTRAIATNGEASNKLLYAANLTLPPGKSLATVVVKTRDETLRVPLAISVLPSETTFASYWTYIALVPLGVVLFTLNQYLKHRAPTVLR